MFAAKKITVFIIITIIVIAASILLSDKKNDLILLTWQDEDTSTTMTINHITDNGAQSAMVYYDTKTHAGNPGSYRYKLQGEVRSYPGVNFQVYSTNLEGLSPDEIYYFIVGNEVTGYSDERKFRTVPETGEIKFISGGDTSITDDFEEVCELAALTEPHFAIIGGDLAYANGDIQSQDLWLELLDIWQDTMVTPEGYTIPAIAAIGNHEVASANQPPHTQPTQDLAENAPFYNMIFQPAADKTFFKRNIGSDSILFLLDTDHIFSSDGIQLDWMEKNFAAHQNDKFRFASYHVPLYPSFRDPESFRNVLLRDNWLEVFDQNHLDIAFENHEHTLKKSKLLRGNQIVDSQGTLYIGDGAWGKYTRTPKDQWYIEMARQIHHVWIVTLNGNTATFNALTIDGVDEDYTFEVKATKNTL